MAAEIKRDIGASADVVAPLLKISALRVPTVEMLAALTFIAASTPIIPPLWLSIMKFASPVVVRSPVRVKLTAALPTMVPPHN